MVEIKNLLEFYELLQDEESKILFEMRMELLMQQSKWSDFITKLLSMNKEWRLSDYDDFREVYDQKPIIIFGVGTDGKVSQHILKQMGIDVWGFCDNDSNKWGSEYDGKPVISPKEVIWEHRDKFIVLASRKHKNSFYNQLTTSLNPFPKENIWFPRVGSLYATTGWQYFDCPEFKVKNDEVFVDAGCFDGSTSRDFVKWSEGNYKKIYAFEPDRDCYLSSKKLEDDLKEFKVFNLATWSEKKVLHFNMTSDGSSLVDKNSGTDVEANSIDNMLYDEAPTFIKLDVEGAEYNTLLGAAKTIKKYKPRLAVSIYHKDVDIFEIPLLLMKLRGDYRFYIRHYASTLAETVLYAI